MTQIKTAGELRTFLTGVLLDIRRGEVEVDKAKAIAAVAAQINTSLAVEVAAAVKLEKMDGAYTHAGSMVIGTTTRAELPLDQGGGIWCDQCEARVTPEEASGCRSRYCKVKAAA